MHHETSASKHHDAQVFTNIVKITFDGSHDYDTSGLSSRCGENWLDVSHPCLHRPSSNQYFGHEDQVVPKLHTNDRHAVQQAIVEELVRSESIGKSFYCEPVDINVITDN